MTIPEKDYYMCVYILRCSDGTFYTGVTNNLKIRFSQHQEGLHETSYTFSRRPLELVYYLGFQNALEAIAYEKKLKRWGAKKKEALINGDFEALKAHSKKKNFKR